MVLSARLIHRKLHLAQSDITALTATEAAAEIARGAISAEDYTAACLERIAAVGPRGARLHPSRPRACAGAGARARSQQSQRRADRPAARHSGRHQGHLRYRRLSDRVRFADSCRPPARRPMPPWFAELREAGAVIIGKTVTTEFAYFHPGKTRNPRDPDAHARRLVVRLGRGGRGRHGAAGDRLADQRLDDPAGRVLRRVRRQTQPWPDFARRRADACRARSTMSAHSRARSTIWR